MTDVLFKIGKKQVTDRDAVVALIISLFLPGFVSLPMLAVVFFTMIFNPRARALAFQGKGSLLLLAFGGMGMLAALIGGNWLGILCTLGVVAVLAVGQFMFKVVDESVTARVTKGICRLMPLVAAFTLVEFAIRIYFVVIKGQKIRFMTRCFSYFFNPNYFGAAMAMTALFFIYRFIKEKEGRGKNFLYGCLAIMCMVLSQSLLSCLSFVVGAAVLLAVSKKWGYLGLLAGCVGALAAVILLFPDYIPRLNEISETFELRLRIWRVAREGFKQSPIFGQGHLTYFHIYGDYVGKLDGVEVWPTQHAHNLIFDSLLNYGIVGAAVLWTYLGNRMRLLIKGFKGGDRCTVALIIGVAVTVFLHGMLDVTLIWSQTGILFLYLVALPTKGKT